MGELNVNVPHYGFPLSGIPFRQILPAGGTDNGNQVEWKFLNLPLSTAKDIVVVYNLAPFKIHSDVVQDRGARHLLKPLNCRL